MNGHGQERYPRTSSMFKNPSCSTCPEIGLMKVVLYQWVEVKQWTVISSAKNTEAITVDPVEYQL